MSKWPYRAATSTWFTWAPGQLATSPSWRCCWPRTGSLLALWRSTWWWPSWAASSKSLSRPSPTSPTPSSGIRQTPTTRRSLALQRLWVSSCYQAADCRCCVSDSLLSLATFRQWTWAELWKIDVMLSCGGLFEQGQNLMRNNDAAEWRWNDFLFFYAGVLGSALKIWGKKKKKDFLKMYPKSHRVYKEEPSLIYLLLTRDYLKILHVGFWIHKSIVLFL